MLSRLPLQDLLRLEPQSDLLLSALDAVGTVADVSADIDGIVTTDGTWLRSERVGGTEDHTTGLAGITTFPDHSANWAGKHVYSFLSEIIALERRTKGKVNVQVTKPLKNGFSERSS